MDFPNFDRQFWPVRQEHLTRVVRLPLSLAWFGVVWGVSLTGFGVVLGVSLTGFDDVVSTFFVLFSDFFQSSSSEAAKKTKQTAINL